MRVNKKILIVAIILGLVTVFGLSRYIQYVDGGRVDKSNYQDVIVAANTIPQDVRITAEMLTTESMPADAVHPDAIQSVEEVVDGISRMEIVKGEQILANKVVVDGTDASLAYRIPDNMRAVSIPTDEISGVAGYINVGDKIDILVTTSQEKVVTSTQFQNIEILAVGNAKQGDPESQTGLPASLTLLTSPQQAQALANARANGAINLSLRNPSDAGTIDAKANSAQPATPAQDAEGEKAAENKE